MKKSMFVHAIGLVMFLGLLGFVGSMDFEHENGHIEFITVQAGETADMELLEGDYVITPEGEKIVAPIEMELVLDGAGKYKIVRF